jgi:DNA-binding MurR/RpiR family transcriptional regulator
MTEDLPGQSDSAMTNRRNNVEALRARIVQRYEGLSPRLKQVAAYALEHPNDIGLETLAVIAKRCKVQPSTIVRFAKTFGYDGASEMQKLFRDELLSLAPSPSYADRIRQFNERAGDVATQSPSELLREFTDGNIAALQHLNESTRQADLERAVRMIGEAETVYLVGLRRSFPVAAYLAYALRHADKRAYLIDGLAGMLVEQSTMLGPNDLLIATSFRSYAQQTADIVNEAHERGARIIAISDSRLSPIARHADLCFEVKDAEFRKFRSLTASLCLAQTLVISYAFQLTATRKREGA